MTYLLDANYLFAKCKLEMFDRLEVSIMKTEYIFFIYTSYNLWIKTISFSMRNVMLIIFCIKAEEFVKILMKRIARMSQLMFFFTKKCVVTPDPQRPDKQL